ncbi:MAG: outer membrane beta-barrel protein [Rhodothermales bacterium]
MIRNHLAGAGLCLALICTARTTFGQAFGFNGGLQKANIKTDEAKNAFGTEVGYTLGFFLNIGLPSNFGIFTEARYSQKIITQQEAADAQHQLTNPDVKLDLGSIEIPVALAWKPPVKGRVRPRIYAGPVISVIVNQQVELTEKSPGDVINEAFVLTRDAFADRDLGWVAGAGLSIKLIDLGITTLQLMGDVRYVGGLNSVNKDFAGNPLRRSIGVGAFNAMVGVGF